MALLSGAHRLPGLFRLLPFPSTPLSLTTPSSFLPSSLQTPPQPLKNPSPLNPAQDEAIKLMDAHEWRKARAKADELMAWLADVSGTATMEDVRRCGGS